MTKVTVKDTEITVVKIKDEDYLCLTDMLKAKDELHPNYWTL